ncbi:hypothetical protein [Planomonospora sp. ID82291]|uniref:hypothetical protein n=1 Tax=Planomonospora sp. ID82291 TaxID=2738136 RepID=UPI0018C3845A|nr:hypothetical protein [Planomonospora sp. ID82291]MBG0815533.1 hypothetical protein [Planomonospora sp. ID82291]
MRATAPVIAPVAAARRFGYSVAVVVDTVLLYMINVAPGWQTVPFLTEETWQVLPMVNLSLAAGAVANLVYMICDPRWLRSLGDLVTTAISLIALVGILRVFPFAFGDPSVDWALVARSVLVVSVAGTAVAVVVHLVSFVRRAAGGRYRSDPHR